MYTCKNHDRLLNFNIFIIFLALEYMSTSYAACDLNDIGDNKQIYIRQSPHLANQA